MRVGLVGTGMLGEAVGLHLIESGHEVSAYNRTRSKTDRLREHGAAVLDSPADVASASEVVITCVTDARAVRDVAFGDDSITSADCKPVVADMSTIDPVESESIAAEYQKHGIRMLCIPVMGGPNVAINGKLTMMVSGDRDSYERYCSLWDDIAEHVFYLGEGAAAHSVKLAMNLQIAMLALSLSEGIVLCRGASIDPEIFLKVLNSTYFGTGMSKNKAYRMVRDEYGPTFTLANLKKDLHTINSAAGSFGLSLPMGETAEQVYQKAVEAGLGQLDYTGILAYLSGAASKKSN